MTATSVRDERLVPAQPVGWLARLTSSLFGRRLSFPPATHRVTVRRVTVPMRDGIRLDADLFIPIGQSRGTMLVRSP